MYKTCSPVMYQLRVRTAGASFVQLLAEHYAVLEFVVRLYINYIVCQADYPSLFVFN